MIKTRFWKQTSILFAVLVLFLISSECDAGCPELSVSPTSLDFGTIEVSLTITVRNTGEGTLNWNASESLDWLSLNKTLGKLLTGSSEDVTAAVSRSGKLPGAYNGTISFTSNGGNQDVSIFMIVPELAPALSVSPTSLDFGTIEVSLTITVRNTGTGTLNWNASESLDWLSLNKTLGKLSTGSSEDVTAAVSRSGKLPGAYNGTISFTSNGGNQDVSVFMAVPELAAVLEPHAYPVPWKPNDGKDETGTEQGGITFINLSAQGVIKIYSMSGELVMKYEYKPADIGKWTWDVKTSNKEEVFSGVYIYYIESGKEHKTGRLIIIR